MKCSVFPHELGWSVTTQRDLRSGNRDSFRQSTYDRWWHPKSRHQSRGNCP